jgi:hypothetical protein
MQGRGTKQGASVAIADWQEVSRGLFGRAADEWAGDVGGLDVGQRFHRVGLPSVVWRVVRVYRDPQGVAHAILASNRGDLDPKTLSETVLFDRRQYRLI